jgi:hypothetical protein
MPMVICHDDEEGINHKFRETIPQYNLNAYVRDFEALDHFS